MSTHVKTASIAEVYGLRKTHNSKRNKRLFSGKRMRQNLPTLHASNDCVSKTIQAIASKFSPDLDHTSTTLFIMLCQF